MPLNFTRFHKLVEDISDLESIRPDDSYAYVVLDRGEGDETHVVGVFGPEQIEQVREQFSEEKSLVRVRTDAFDFTVANLYRRPYQATYNLFGVKLNLHVLDAATVAVTNDPLRELRNDILRVISAEASSQLGKKWASSVAEESQRPEYYRDRGLVVEEVSAERHSLSRKELLELPSQFLPLLDAAFIDEIADRTNGPPFFAQKAIPSTARSSLLDSLLRQVRIPSEYQLPHASDSREPYYQCAENSAGKVYTHRDLATLPPDIYIDVAVPRQVVLGVPFDLCVWVRPPAYPTLTVADLPHIETGEAMLYIAHDESFVPLRVLVKSIRCTFVDSSTEGRSEQSFRMARGRPSPKLYFSLIPHIVGQISIAVELYQEQDATGSTRVVVRSKKPPIGRVTTRVVSKPVALVTPRQAARTSDPASVAQGVSIIETKKRRLRILEQQHARKGYNAPPEIILEIEDLRHEIAEAEG